MQTLTSRQVYANSWMTVREDAIRLADGTESIYGVVDKPTYALVIPRDGDRLHLVDGLLVALRVGDYKMSFAEQRLAGTMGVWAEPFTKLRLTKIYNLMQDPFERADITSNTYYDWLISRAFLIFYATAITTQFLQSFREFPPRQKPASFTIDQAVEKLNALIAGG